MPRWRAAVDCTRPRWHAPVARESRHWFDGAPNGPEDEMTTAPLRQLTLVAFLQAQNCSNYPASWRHAESMPDFTTAEYYQRIARTLEAGKFQLAFFDDRLAMP